MMSFSLSVSVNLGLPQSCPQCWVMVQEGLEDTHGHIRTHCGHDRPKPQAPMWNESVNRALFLPWAALWVNYLTQTLKLCVSVLFTYSFSYVSIADSITYKWFNALNMFTELPLSCLILLSGEFCLHALWPWSELFCVELLPSEGRAAHLAFSTCRAHWLGYWVTVRVNRYFPSYPWALA